MNKLITAGVAVLLTGGLVAGTQIASSEAATKKTARVIVGDDFFKAKTVTIRSGGTVTWVWRGSAPHDVRGRGGMKSRVQTEGTYKKRFKKRGTYSYVCTIHDGMEGKVRVVRG